MSADPVRHAIASVWKDEGPRVVGYLVRILRDVSLAEELAHDALVAALEDWPRDGVPDRPGAWLMATAKHRALNTLRRGALAGRKHVELAGLHEPSSPERQVDALHDAIDDDVGDDLLRLLFTACHPVLSAEARAALTLR